MQVWYNTIRSFSINFFVLFVSVKGDHTFEEGPAFIFVLSGSGDDKLSHDNILCMFFCILESSRAGSQIRRR
jgi:hypothetical protein